MSEELKAIVEVIGNLGDEGVKAFVWYLTVSLVRTILELATIVTVVTVIVKGVYKLFTTVNRVDELHRLVPETRDYSSTIRMAIDSKFWLKDKS